MNTLQSTEHSRLFVVESENRLNDFPSETTTENLDLFDYVNSKFVYVERHIKKQMKKLYRELMIRKCKLEKDLLRHTISLAITIPEQSGYLLTKKPGNLIFLAGEAVHLIKCVPVSVMYRETEFCYQELPVTYDNKTYFLTPRKHILTSTGVRTACNKLAPPHFKVGKQWYKMLPEIILADAPSMLNPKLEDVWAH